MECFLLASQFNTVIGSNSLTAWSIIHGVALFKLQSPHVLYEELVLIESHNESSHERCKTPFID
jgi:hypothetical protein